jgi:hypothetical protein
VLPPQEEAVIQEDETAPPPEAADRLFGDTVWLSGIDPESVVTAARALHGAGLCWDAARLAGQAAIRTADRKAMVTLLDCARELQGKQAVTDQSPTKCTINT